MECKNGAEHLQSLKDGRTVYLDGKRVDDVTTHPASAMRLLPRACCMTISRAPKTSS